MNKNLFWDKMEEINNITYTANGDITNKSSLSGLCDLMFKAPLMKEKSDVVTCYRVFLNAYMESPIDAIRLLFYVRDVRGGQGTRAFFLNVMTSLARFKPEIAVQIIRYVPEYGSWKDVFELFKVRHFFHESVTDELITMIKNQMKSDTENMLNNKSISLMFKWMPSENTSSKESIYAAKELRKVFGFDSKTYRKLLSASRKYLDIIERKMCANKFDLIEYKNVPSKAMSLYKNSFIQHDESRFAKYLEELKTGKTKINAGVLYPCDITKQYLRRGYYSVESMSKAEQTVNEEQWKALPDFFAGKTDNSIVVADTSGSMFNTTSASEKNPPINICLSLALYIAERNKGKFHNKFITFSAHPELQSIKGNTLIERLENLERAEWMMNTDIDKVFNLLFNAVTPETVKDLPTSIYIISDMQFDSCCSRANETVFKFWQKRFKEELGVELPRVIFWNVNGQYGTVPITIKENGAVLISGYSPSILKYVMEDNISNTYGLIKSITESARYSVINVKIS